MANTKDFIVKNGLTVGNNITVSGTVDGRDIATDGSKLDGIESGATADQTASEILTLIKTVDGSGSGLDADTLDGIQGSGFLQTSGGTLTGALSGTSLSLSLSASGTQFTGTAQSTTAPTTDDAKFDGFGVQGNRTTNPVYVHNQGAGGVRISSNASLGTPNGILVKDTVTDISGNLTISGTVDGRDVAADGTKLDGIESGATADQSASEILTLIKTVDGSGSGLDADTLDGLNSTSLASNNYVQSQLGLKLNSSSYTASDVLTKIKTVDGSGSGLDADTLDGLQSGSFSTNNYITDHYTSNNYIQSYVAAQVASVVDSAPAALDTLNELAAALGDDANFSTTVSNQIGIRSTNTYVNSTFSSNNYLQGQLSTKLNSSSYTASDVLTKIKTVDGSGSGLDADTLDGLNSTSLASNNYVQTQLGTKLNSSSYTASDVLTKIKTVDGSGSGLDADLLDGIHVSGLVSNNYFQDNSGSGGGATGGGSDAVFHNNDQTVTTNYSIPSGQNSMSAGPITINSGVTVTVPSGSEWTIV